MLLIPHNEEKQLRRARALAGGQPCDLDDFMVLRMPPVVG